VGEGDSASEPGAEGAVVAESGVLAVPSFVASVVLAAESSPVLLHAIAKASAHVVNQRARANGVGAAAGPSFPTRRP
jgi:hypothetical protein